MAFDFKTATPTAFPSTFPFLLGAASQSDASPKIYSPSKVAFTQPATGCTWTLVDGKTFTVSNTLTFSGTDSASVAFGVGGTVAYLNVANTFTQNQTLSGVGLIFNGSTLFGDAADVIAQRDGTNAQKFTIYNTYTNGAVYERFSIDWAATANVLTLKTEAASGTVRDITISPNSLINFDSQSTNSMQLSVRAGSGGGANNNVTVFFRANSSNIGYVGRVSSVFGIFDGSASALATFISGSTILGSGALATNATDGFLYVATCAGTPTGVPTTRTGRVALLYDTTNDQFWVYNGAWKQPKTPAGAATVTWQ